MDKRIWISFDFGISGDFDGIYHWLDSHSAVECGENCASLLYPAKKDVAKEVAASLRKSVKLRKKDRVYMIWRKLNGKVSGQFIHGKRRRSPWSGYAMAVGDVIDEG